MEGGDRHRRPRVPYCDNFFDCGYLSAQLPYHDICAGPPGFALMERFLRELLPSGFENVSAVRSAAMGKVRSRNNRTTELRLRMALIRLGQRGWVLHPNLPGRPDFFFVRAKLAVFVDGCFWHGCKKCGHVPKTRSRFWSAKIERNRRRDRRTARTLRSCGIRVLRIWEHSLNSGHSLRKIIMNINRFCEPQ
jgi:DNA mismatch endonuclease, patch repair protein